MTRSRHPERPHERWRPGPDSPVINYSLRAVRFRTGRLVADVARATGISYGVVHRIEMAKYRPTPIEAAVIAEYLGCKDEEVWPPTLEPRPQRKVKERPPMPGLDSREARAVLRRGVVADPAEGLHREDLARVIAAVLAKLRPRVALVLRLRLGLGHEDPMTLDEIGSIIHRTGSLVRQIEWRGLSLLRFLAGHWPEVAELAVCLGMPVERCDRCLRRVPGAGARKCPRCRRRFCDRCWYGPLGHGHGTDRCDRKGRS